MPNTQIKTTQADVKQHRHEIKTLTTALQIARSQGDKATIASLASRIRVARWASEVCNAGPRMGRRQHSELCATFGRILARNVAELRTV